MSVRSSRLGSDNGAGSSSQMSGGGIFKRAKNLKNRLKSWRSPKDIDKVGPEPQLLEKPVTGMTEGNATSGNTVLVPQKALAYVECILVQLSYLRSFCEVQASESTPGVSPYAKPIRLRFRKSKQTIRRQQQRFQSIVRGRLLPLVIRGENIDEKIETILDDPKSAEEWRSQELEKEIGDRLPSSYKLLVSSLGTVWELLDRSKNEINLSAKFLREVSESGETGLSRGWPQFTATDSKLESIFDRLELELTKLEGYLNVNDDVLERQSQKKPRDSGRGTKLDQFSIHAKRLYEFLNQAWVSDGGGRRRFELLLQQMSLGEKRFRIRFFLDEQSSPAPQTWTVVDTDIEHSAYRPANDYHTIKNFYTTFKTVSFSSSAPERTLYGILTDNQMYYSVYRPSREDMTRESPQSLKKFLGTLDQTDRLSIAHGLALSVARFHSTPWLTEDWTAKDIIFYRKPGSPASVLLEQPFLSGYLRKRNPEVNAIASTAPTAVPTSFADRVIERLGIMLLELCFSKSIEDTDQYRDSLKKAGQGCDPLWVRRNAAMEWSLSVGEWYGSGWANAISWCLNASTEYRTRGSNSCNLREEIMSEVVDPLQESRSFEQMTDKDILRFMNSLTGDIKKGGVGMIGGHYTFHGPVKIGG